MLLVVLIQINGPGMSGGPGITRDSRPARAAIYTGGAATPAPLWAYRNPICAGACPGSGTALVFPCRRDGRGWLDVRANRSMPLEPTHWRLWRHEGR
jgi:hypothetical protein